MEKNGDTDATQQPDTPQSATGTFNRRVGERLHCEQPTEAQESSHGGAVHSGVVQMGEELTRGEVPLSKPIHINNPDESTGE